MLARLLATALTGAMLFAGASALQAQTTTAPSAMPTLDGCRDEAIRRGISGDGLSAFMSQCMSQPAAASSAQRTSLDRCRSDAVARNMSGDARATYIDDCMQQSGAPSAATTTGSYGYCRTQARGRGLSGTALDEFLNGCINQ